MGDYESTTEPTYTTPDGTSWTVTRRATDLANESFEIEMHVPPHAVSTPPHVHPRQTDEFNVVSGRVEVLLDGAWRVLGPGDELVVPPNHVHTYRNEFDEPAVLRNVHNPTDSFQEYLDRLGLLVSSGRITSMTGLKAKVYMSVLFRQHQDSMVLASPVLRVLSVVLALGARLSGVKVPRPPSG
ncbi:cupin domain-containing protein [Spongisporangium articulatum]|uniref:Cupin domain-containing protein n=1 Tax=Spongisporangium articulatum TaxID=3362603 RepID=A0ABW8AJL5_9ACTN